MSDEAPLTETAGAVSPESGGEPEIPVFDLKVEQEDLDAVEEALRSGWWTMGKRVEELEGEFATAWAPLTGRRLELHDRTPSDASLRGGGPWKRGHPALIHVRRDRGRGCHRGAKPVFADIRGDHDLGIDPEDVERLITPSTKAVIAVHYAGFAADVERLAEICDREGIAFIEDCAHAPAGNVGDKQLGTFGFAGALSFFSNKVFAAGEGGLLVTDDADAAERAGHQGTRGSCTPRRNVMPGPPRNMTWSRSDSTTASMRCERL